MTNDEARGILRRIADRRLMIHVNGQVMEADADEIDKVLRLAISALSRDRWISVEERLPNNGVYVLAYFDDGHIGTVHSEWPQYPNKYVTHWRPLPEPPKEKHDV